MREDESVLIKALGSSPRLKIIDFLLDNPLFDFSKKEIIEGADISKKTFYKYWEEIERSDLVKETRKFGKAQLYQINKESPVVKHLIEIERELVDQSASENKKVIA